MADTASTLTESPVEITDALIDALLVGAIDLHCHSGPSVMPRRIDHIAAMEEAAANRLKAVLFKDHYYSVTPVAELLKAHYAHLDIMLLSGVPLNNTSGGLNPYAVDHGLKLGARVVWMPTFSAANHIRHGHRHVLLPTKEAMLPPTALSVVDEKGRLKDEVKEILDVIAAHDAVLSAGHLHISEIWPLFDEATRRGVKRLLVNHPSFVIDASLSDMAELARMGAFLEHSVCMFVEGSRFKKFSPEQLRGLIDAAGVDRTILGSDLGQVSNPTPVEGFRLVIRLCLEMGYAPADVRRMIGLNACRLMGLDPAS
ncbi:DUF6282 family protein [Shumkonia mesophila]|uniref:DUF6282 family protein n=1 Tax=Shumkonia mesophila TaxID=2838854 RepID=UPI00293512F6|nr:DUF6282 family protein [Shumkonia mesophila]